MNNCSQFQDDLKAYADGSYPGSAGRLSAAI